MEDTESKSLLGKKTTRFRAATAIGIVVWSCYLNGVLPTVSLGAVCSTTLTCRSAILLLPEKHPSSLACANIRAGRPSVAARPVLSLFTAGFRTGGRENTIRNLELRQSHAVTSCGQDHWLQQRCAHTISCFKRLRLRQRLLWDGVRLPASSSNPYTAQRTKQGYLPPCGGILAQLERS